MPDRRRSRGPHPKDKACFESASLADLQAAVADLSWLLARRYSARAALKLVGNRYALRDRQRRALQRTAAGSAEVAGRRAREVDGRSLAGETLAIDGYNVLLTLEAALSGGVLLLARDGTLRDLASVGAHYRPVAQTRPAIRLIDRFVASRQVERVVFYLDSPVSNSGRLKRLIETVVEGRRPRWQVRLVAHVDRALSASPNIVATADSAILDRCGRWHNLARGVVEETVPAAWIVDLAGDPAARATAAT